MAGHEQDHDRSNIAVAERVYGRHDPVDIYLARIVDASDAFLHPAWIAGQFDDIKAGDDKARERQDRPPYQ